MHVGPIVIDDMKVNLGLYWMFGWIELLALAYKLRRRISMIEFSPEGRM